MKKIILALAVALMCFGQSGTYTYTVTKQTVLAAGPEVITVQQPASNSRPLRFVTAYFDCSVACAFTLERNGTAATATTLAPVNVNPGQPAPAAKAFSGSNVGVGTVLSTFNCSAACSTALDISDLVFPAGGTASNLTLRSSSITGTVDIAFKFREVVTQ